MVCKLREEMPMQWIHKEEVILAGALVEEAVANVGVE
jgi:hypothetical protein